MSKLPLPQLTDNPIALVQAWLAAAGSSEPADANAAALATVSTSGMPSVRMVLVKDIQETGFIFYTNRHSRKGSELAENPQAALCFYWKSLARQVRVEGRCAPISAAQSDSYFHSRDRESQLAAAASQQSQPLATPQQYADEVDALDVRYAGQPVPRPTHWQGYSITPTAIEVWVAGKHRRHLRIRYTRNGDVWQAGHLYP